MPLAVHVLSVDSSPGTAVDVLPEVRTKVGGSDRAGGKVVTAPIRNTGTQFAGLTDLERAAALAAEQAKALNGAYWKLREHASEYRSANVFRRAMEAYKADRDDPVKCRRAMNHEWYARWIEAAARTVAEMLGAAEHEIDALPPEEG